jgi:hypothetical protein
MEIKHSQVHVFPREDASPMITPQFNFSKYILKHRVSYHSYYELKKHDRITQNQVF